MYCCKAQAREKTRSFEPPKLEIYPGCAGTIPESFALLVNLTYFAAGAIQRACWHILATLIQWLAVRRSCSLALVERVLGVREGVYQLLWWAAAAISLAMPLPHAFVVARH